MRLHNCTWLRLHFFSLKAQTRACFTFGVCLSTYTPNTKSPRMIKQSDSWYASAHFLELNQAHPWWNNCFPCLPQSNRTGLSSTHSKKPLAQKFAEFSLTEGVTLPWNPLKSASHSMDPATITLTAQTHLQRHSSVWIPPLFHHTPPNTTHTETCVETSVYASPNAQFAYQFICPVHIHPVYYNL